MGAAQGKKVDRTPLRHRRPRRQPSFGQIKPSEDAWRAVGGTDRKTFGGHLHACINANANGSGAWHHSHGGCLR
jgi:hypothetical protein